MYGTYGRKMGGTNAFKNALGLPWNGGRFGALEALMGSLKPQTTIALVVAVATATGGVKADGPPPS